VERTGAPTHEQGERSPVAVRKKCLAERKNPISAADATCSANVAKFASSRAEERGRKVGRCCWRAYIG
jgi:hypothetical protein